MAFHHPGVVVYVVKEFVFVSVRTSAGASVRVATYSSKAFSALIYLGSAVRCVE
jgi:hypothetical protein